MSKRLTNEDLIKNLMNFSPYGGLCQSFIMQGIEEYCKYVIENSKEIIKNEEELMLQGKMPIMSQKIWIGIAEDVLDRINMFYDPKTNNKLKY